MQMMRKMQKQMEKIQAELAEKTISQEELDSYRQSIKPLV